MQNNENLDGVVEVFKEKDKQGYVMKLYQNYIPDEDLCIWVYENVNDKTINAIIGNHSNCNEFNQCIGDGLSYRKYPIISNIKKEIVGELLDISYSYYNKKIKI